MYFFFFLFFFFWTWLTSKKVANIAERMSAFCSAPKEEMYTKKKVILKGSLQKCPTYSTWGHYDPVLLMQVSAWAGDFSPHSFPHPVYYQGAHSTKFPQYLLLGLKNLFSILGSYYDEDNKGVYQQFLPMERSLKKAGEITLKALPWSQANMLSPVTKRIGSV